MHQRELPIIPQRIAVAVAPVACTTTVIVAVVLVRWRLVAVWTAVVAPRAGLAASADLVEFWGCICLVCGIMSFTAPPAALVVFAAGAAAFRVGAFGNELRVCQARRLTKAGLFSPRANRRPGRVCVGISRWTVVSFAGEAWK